MGGIDVAMPRPMIQLHAQKNGASVNNRKGEAWRARRSAEELVMTSLWTSAPERVREPLHKRRVVATEDCLDELHKRREANGRPYG